MTPPRKGSVDGLHGLPVIKGNVVRIYVNGDMPRGIVSWNADEGWCDVLVWGDDGVPVSDGENFVSRRIFGKVEVVSADG